MGVSGGSVFGRLAVRCESPDLLYLPHVPLPFSGCRTFGGSGGIALEVSAVVLLESHPFLPFVFPLVLANVLLE